jgi:hypothetical protein
MILSWFALATSTAVTDEATLAPAAAYAQISSMWTRGDFAGAANFAVAASDSLGSGFDADSRAAALARKGADTATAVAALRSLAVHTLLLTGQRERAVAQLARVATEAPNYSVFLTALNPAVVFGESVAQPSSPRFTPVEILNALELGPRVGDTEWHMLRWEMRHMRDFARGTEASAAPDLAEACAPCSAEKAHGAPNGPPRLAIVVPFVPAERQRLRAMMRRWTAPGRAPCDVAAQRLAHTELVFLCSRSGADAPEWLPAPADAASLVDPSIRACFSAISLRFVGLSADDEVYLGGYNNSAPNSLFGSLFTEEAAQEGEDWWSGGAGEKPFSEGRDLLFWMETDVVPVVSHWLERLDEEARFPRGFWRKGAPAGHFPLRSAAHVSVAATHHRHMNTMGLYRVGDACFRCWVRRVLAEYGNTAFDVASHMYMQSRAHFRDWQRWGHKFIATDALQNWLGPTTRAAALALGPNAVFVHSKAFVDDEAEDVRR